MISVRFKGKTFNITVIQVHALINKAEEAEAEWFYEDLQYRLELTPQKDVFYITGAWNAKVGKEQANLALVYKNEAGQRLIEFCQENALVRANILFKPHKRRLYTWISPDG